MTAPAKLPAPSVDADPAAAYLAERYGPNFRAVLGLVDHPHAETDDSAFYEFFGSEPFDAAPDLTAHRQVCAGMGL